MEGTKKEAHQPSRALRMSRILKGVGGVGFAAAIVLALSSGPVGWTTGSLTAISSGALWGAGALTERLENAPRA